MNKVIIKTPLRISFVGGGSDIPPGPGTTISSTIDKHVYCIALKRRDGKFIINWKEKEETTSIDNIKHAIVRECLREMGFSDSQGVEICFVADVPGVGSGLGSSAATAISTLHALALLRGYKPGEIDRRWLAELASNIQIQKLKSPQGRQDEYTCALGGLLHLSHGSVGPAVIYRRIKLYGPQWCQMNEHFQLFSPSEDQPSRNADEILKTYIIDDSFRKTCIQLCQSFEVALRGQDWLKLAELSWEHGELKRKLSDAVYPDCLQQITDNGIKFKLCGAGGNGHLLVGASRQDTSKVIDKVETIWGKNLPFKFTPYGSDLIYYEW
jgi:D-glycero-alpha-D-manno-heptose-7-phosphate kinase